MKIIKERKKADQHRDLWKVILAVAGLGVICIGMVFGISVRDNTINHSSGDSDMTIPTKHAVIMKSDFYYYKNAEELCKKADTVLIGEIIDKKYEDINVSSEADEDYMPYTVYTLRVSQCFKGTAGTVYSFKVLGGETSDTIYEYKDAVQFEMGSQYLIATEEYGNDTYASLLNPIQAAAEYNSQSNKLTLVGTEVSIDEISGYCQEQ